MTIKEEEVQGKDDEVSVKMEHEEDMCISEYEEKPSTEVMDRYSELDRSIDTVARNHVLDEKPRMTKKMLPQKTRLKKKEKVKKRRLCANPILLKAPLIVNEQLSTHQSNGRDQMWWFVLKLLMNPDSRHIAAWTGHYYSFRVIDKDNFTRMWCDCNDRSKMIAWSSVCRSMRLCYGDKGILTPVSQQHSLWAFVVDISIPLKMSRETVQEFIDLHKVVPPIQIAFNNNSTHTQLLEAYINDSVKGMKMDVSSSYASLAGFDSSNDAASLPAPPVSPIIVAPLQLGFLNRPPLTSPLSFSDMSPFHPLSSPYWLPAVHLPPMFSSYFQF